MAQIDIIRKAFDAGSDLGQMTQKRADSFVKSLVDAGEVQRDQAQKLVTDIVERSRENRRRLITTIDREVQKSVGRMGLATKSDLKALGDKVTKLEKAAGKAPAKKTVKKTVKKKAPATKANSAG